MLFECMGICVLSPAHESEMRGYLVYPLIVKILTSLSATVYPIGRPYRGIKKNKNKKTTFFDGSVDHIIHRDYIANRR